MLAAFFTKKRATKKITKSKLLETLKSGRELVDAKKEQLLKTQELIMTAVDETKRMTNDVMSMLSKSKDGGILFVDYKGTVLHANQVACKILGLESADKLIGKSIESLLSSKPRARRHVSSCSGEIFEKMKALEDPTLPAVLGACKAFSFTQVSGTEVVLNEPITLPYGDSKLQVKLSLLETSPASVEHVTYLCKLTRL